MASHEETYHPQQPQQPQQLYAAHVDRLPQWIQEVVHFWKAGQKPALSREDREDMLQESRVALWQAACLYPLYRGTARLRPHPKVLPFFDYAQIQVKGALRAFLADWFALHVPPPCGLETYPLTSRPRSDEPS